MGKKENAVEQPVCDYAEEQGFEVRKIKFIQRDGAPDRLFMGHGVIFFIEFKSPDPDAKLSPQQVREIKKMSECGVEVFVVDNVYAGKLIIDAGVEAGRKKGWVQK